MAIVWFLRRHLPLILAPGAILAAGTAIFLLFVEPPTYEASATLVVAPPAITSDLVPATFSATEYAKLLESDSIVAEVRQDLQRSQGWSPARTADIENTVKVAIHAPTRRDATNSIALLEITTEGRSPEAAATLTNTWAKVLVETSRKVTWGTTASAVALIEQHYPQSEDRLASLEAQSSAIESDYEDRQVALAGRWDKRLTSARKRHEEEISAHQDETRDQFRQIGKSKSLWPAGESPEVAAATDDETTLEPSEQELLSSLLVARRQLAQTLPYRTLKRSLSTEALSEAIVGGKADPESLEAALDGDLALTDQEANPLHSELALTASRIEMDLEREASDGSALVHEVAGELASLQRARSASLFQLVTEQDAELKGLERERRAEVSALRRERRAAIEKVDRKIRTETSLYSELAKHHNEAALLVAQKDLDPLHLATAATQPAAPIPLHAGLKSSLAGLIGVLLGLALATVRELGSG